MRFGLCCLFLDEPVSFRTTTATALLKFPRTQQLARLSEICLHNATQLGLALKAVQRLGIGAFRIMSPLFPRMTHPQIGYCLNELPDEIIITQKLAQIRQYAGQHNIRLSFHPDQFVVLSSPHAAVVANSIRELTCQAMLAEAVGADVINIHAGGVYGNKLQALERFGTVYSLLPDDIKTRLTVENDDVSYSPSDLLPLCHKYSIPLVYDVHHHRCNRDELSIEAATALARETWQTAGREQYCHLSSPRSGWNNGDPKPHADYIDPDDMPECWLGQEMTVDIEAKAKEQAVLKLMRSLAAKRL